MHFGEAKGSLTSIYGLTSKSPSPMHIPLRARNDILVQQWHPGRIIPDVAAGPDDRRHATSTRGHRTRSMPSSVSSTEPHGGCNGTGSSTGRGRTGFRCGWDHTESGDGEVARPLCERNGEHFYISTSLQRQNAFPLCLLNSQIAMHSVRWEAILHFPCVVVTPKATFVLEIMCCQYKFPILA
jgi:hypothetical protein